MLSNYLILCFSLLLLPSVFPRIRVFSNELALLIRWPKYWSFNFSISPSDEYSGLISFRIDWFVGEGNGNPLQCSCLENPVDRGAWRAAFPWGHTESDMTKVTWHARMHACMYGCKSWTIKKVEHQRTDAFELWCWRRVLGIFWTARRLNQLIVKKINTEVKPVNRKGNQH